MRPCRRWPSGGRCCWCFVPRGLTVDHDFDYVSNAVVYGSCVGFVALLVGAWWMRKRWPWATFGVFWAVLALAGRFVVPIGEYINEHQWYVPMIGISLALAAVLTETEDVNDDQNTDHVCAGRNTEEPSVTNQIKPECQWVLDVEGAATWKVSNGRTIKIEQGQFLKRELREIHGILLRILEALEPTPPDLGSPRASGHGRRPRRDDKRKANPVRKREDAAEAARLK